MSIKSLFEDIADAIREKSGSSDTYTPAEMPSAIRSIPSGSSTASGVSYDNTSSGLTASNVQVAIDELSGDVSTINSDLSELFVDNGTYIISGMADDLSGSRQTMIYLPILPNKTVSLTKLEVYGGGTAWGNRVDVTTQADFRTSSSFLKNYYVVGWTGNTDKTHFDLTVTVS